MDVFGLIDFAESNCFQDDVSMSFPDFMELLLELRGTNMATIPTPTHPNQVGILDGVWGVAGSDMVDLIILFVFDCCSLFPFCRTQKMFALYPKRCF